MHYIDESPHKDRSANAYEFVRRVCVWKRGGTTSLAAHKEEFSPRIIEIGSHTWVFRSESQSVSGC